ncbi:hypothetical protein NL108_016125 [Boleophthalmus pectinirostris]|nr:hypothetical protein NL108_016125 [Boleophthalmus pectinirostris]
MYKYAALLHYVSVMLPFSCLVLFWGVQCCRQQASNRSITNFDFFFYLKPDRDGSYQRFWISYSSCISVYHFNYHTGFLIGEFPWIGQTVYPIFTSVEHYIAVVHPIIYLNLKNGHGL